MEAVVAAGESRLISGIDFKLSPTAPYVQSRRSFRMQPMGGNVFQPGSGLATMRFSISGTNEWLDGSTVRVAMTLRNLTRNAGDTSNSPMTPLTTSAASMFQRLRIYTMGGTLVEDVPYLGRTVNMLNELSSSAKSRNDAAEGFRLAITDPPDVYGAESDRPEVVAAGGTRKLLMPVPSGLLSQAKFIPLPFCGPLVIELDLVSTAAEAFTEAAGTDVINWRLEDCYLLADSITLDTQLQEEYSRAIASGHNLPLHFSSYHTVMQPNPSQGDAMVAVSTRGFSRLKTVFVTFYNNIVDTKYKRANYFQHPHQSGTYTPARDNVQYFFQINSKRYPESQVTSLAESFYRLRQAVGRHWGDSSISIHPGQYSFSHFIIGQDMELMATSPGADDVAFSGASTTNGQLVLDLKGLQSNGVGNAPIEVYMTFHYDTILNITSSGVDPLV